MRPLFCEFVYTRNIGQPCKCNVAVATPDGIIKDARVLCQSDDSFGEFHRGEACFASTDIYRVTCPTERKVISSTQRKSRAL